MLGMLGRIQDSEERWHTAQTWTRGASGIPCTGSYKLPNPVTKVNIASSQHSQHSLSANPQPNDRVDNNMQASSNDDHSKRLPTDNGGSDTSHLQHPKWRTLMNRVPKATGAHFATAFCDILTKSQQTPPNSTFGIVCFHLLKIFSPSHREEEATEIWLTWS